MTLRPSFGSFGSSRSLSCSVSALDVGLGLDGLGAEQLAIVALGLA